MDMEVDSPIPNPDEIMHNWRSISAVMETILPYPFDLEKLRTQKARSKSPLDELEFTGRGTGFKPDMNLGPYNKDQLQGKNKSPDKMTKYDML